MKIQREELLKVLKRVAPTVKARTTIPELSTVKVWAINGRFHAMATNLDSFCEAVCVCKGDLDYACVAPGPLISMASYGPEQLELTKDGSKLLVKGVSTAKLSTYSADCFPPWPDKGVETGVNIDDLKEAIQSVMWAGDPNPATTIGGQSVWVSMDTKSGVLQAVAMHNRMMAWFRRKAVVANAQMRFLCEQGPLLCEVMSGEQPKLRISDSFVEIRTIDGSCAVKQTEAFKVPLDIMESAISQATPVGSIPKTQLLTELATIRSVATDFAYCKSTFSKDEMSLDYVGKVNEFHSMVPVDSLAKQPKSQCSGGDTSDKSGGSVDSNMPHSLTHLPRSDAAESPLSICFDAALLHTVIKNTPGENLACKLGERMVVFESGDVTTALALVDPTMYP